MPDKVVQIANEAVERCEDCARQFRAAVNQVIVCVKALKPRKVVARLGDDSVAMVQFWVENDVHFVAIEVAATLQPQEACVVTTIYQKSGGQFDHWTHQDVEAGLQQFKAIVNGETDNLNTS